MIINISSLSEIFTGEDNIIYENIYYIGICKNDENIRINANNIHQINEIKNIGLYNKIDALSKIRPYNKSKIDIIIKVFEFIDKYKKDLILK